MTQTLTYQLQSYLAVGVLKKGRQPVAEASGVHVNTIDRLVSGKEIYTGTLNKIELGLRKLDYGKDALSHIG